MSYSAASIGGGAAQDETRPSSPRHPGPPAPGFAAPATRRQPLRRVEAICFDTWWLRRVIRGPGRNDLLCLLGPTEAVSRGRVQPSPCARARNSDDGLMSFLYLLSFDVCSACSHSSRLSFFLLAKTAAGRVFRLTCFALVGSDSYVFFVFRRLRAALPAGFWICLLLLFLYTSDVLRYLLPTPVPLCICFLLLPVLSYSIHLIFFPAIRTSIPFPILRLFLFLIEQDLTISSIVGFSHHAQTTRNIAR